MTDFLCPNCNSSNTKPFGFEERERVKWVFVECKNCDHDWPEEVRKLEDSDSFLDLEIDATLLGIELFEAGNECLQILGLYPQAVRRDSANGTKEEKSCLAILKELNNLIINTEVNFGNEKMSCIFSECTKQVLWGVEEIRRLKEETMLSTVSRETERILTRIESYQSMALESVKEA